MDQRKDRASRQEVLDFKCKKIIHGAQKSMSQSPPTPVQKTAPIGPQNPGSNISLQTPEKIDELSRKETEAEVPEKYKSVVEFFDYMTCSLRLLRLRKKLSTFQNISPQVEVLTKRKLSYRHLAQIKYLLPEAIQIDKILVHDEKTLCMTPDMKVILRFDVVEGHDEHSDFMALRKVFASRVMKFFANNPEGCDIPVALLPEPFCQQTQITIPEVESKTLMKNGLLSEPSHLCPSFSRDFSREVVAEAEIVVPESDMANRGEEKKGFPGIGGCESPVIKPPSSSADKLMVETPAQVPPQRVLTSCEDEVKMAISQNYKPAKRALNFVHSEDENIDISAVRAPLSGLVASIHSILKSSSMTKEELVHKIIINNCDLTEPSEAEEQIQLLEKLVPDWICKRKLAHSGDILYTINKVSDLGAIQAKLAASYNAQ